MRCLKIIPLHHSTGNISMFDNQLNDYQHWLFAKKLSSSVLKNLFRAAGVSQHWICVKIT